MDISAVVDDIYEAAVVPEAWTGVLDPMAAISGAEGTLLFASGEQRTHWMSSAALEPFVTDWLSSKWPGTEERARRLIPMREARFLTDLDAFAREEWEADPYRVGFLEPRGLGWCVGTSIRSPAGDTLAFTSERQWRKGPVERDAVDRLDNLRPYLTRAAVLSARIGLERARATVNVLQTIGLLAAVLTGSRRVVAANPDFETNAPRIVIDAGDRVSFANPAAQALFVEALARADGRPTLLIGRSIAVPGDGERPALVAHLLPLRGGGRDVFTGASSLLYLTSLTTSKAPDVKLLEVLFDLTPAEARIAGLLVEGKTVEAIAAAQGVTDNTVRMHLKSVFAETGVNRQAQLVSLLALPS
ncbi:MAG: helix-turn-helix transcriptional regulator [Reyranella sp.]|nr:helix-turn-helix transcriptional regulator [Reyranella sp.]